ncbi:surface protease GP63, partial [Trypanosoma cruzi]
HTLLPLFYSLLVFLQAHTTTRCTLQWIWMLFCSVCWQLRVAAAVFFRGHEENEGEGVRSPRLLSCGCGAPRVTALSWAPRRIEGGMAGNFFCRVMMDEGPLAAVAGVVCARSVCVVWAATCNTMSDLRPYIGAMNFDPKYMTDTAWSVRVAAH